MSTEPDHAVCEILYPALDRFRESHWHLHNLSVYYHQAEPFRWTLNSTIRALREVDHMLTMSVQKLPGGPEWYRPHRKELHEDPLFSKLAKDRDLVVHQGMLRTKSTAHVGLTRGPGRGIKIGVPFRADPLDDSDEIMQQLVAMCAENDFLRDLVTPDYDLQPGIWRVWRLASFPDEEVRHVIVEAWKRVGVVLSEAYARFGRTTIDFREMPCLGSHEDPSAAEKLYPRSLFGPDIESP